MKKAECEQRIRYLCHRWREVTGQADKPALELSCQDFTFWLRENYPECLQFRTRSGVHFDIGLWFDQEFRLTWTR